MSATPIKVKLTAFIRSYHQQQLIQGLLSTALQSVLLFYLVNYTEYLFWLDAPVRGLLFYGFWLLIALLLAWQVGRPAAQYFQVSSTALSEVQAARIIGNHFGEISDKLLNLLQLEQMGTSALGQSALLLKSIEQKTALLRPFAFSEALNWPAFRKSMYRFAGVLLILLMWGIYDAPSISAASQRLFRYGEQFSRPAPFQFVTAFSDTHVNQNAALIVGVSLKGNAIPEDVFVRVDRQNFLMKATQKNAFVWPIDGIKEDLSFQFEAAGYTSPTYQIRVVPKFELQNIEVQAVYPNYLGRSSEKLDLSSTINIPAGTQLQWLVKSLKAEKVWAAATSRSTEKTAAKLPVITRPLKPMGLGRFNFIERVLYEQNLKLWSVGKGLTSDTFYKQITVVSDAYPEVFLEQRNDQENENGYYALGNAIDDYGIVRAFIEYEQEETGNRNNQTIKTLDLKIAPNKSIVFAHTWDLKLMEIAPDKGLRYRIGVTDNDGVLGGKTAYTDWVYIKRWSDEMLEKQLDRNKEQVEKQLSDAQAQANQLQKQSDKLQESILAAPKMSFDMQDKVEDWLQKQEKQRERIQEIKEQQEKIDRQQKEIAPKNPELKERREELNDRLKRMEDPKIQELMKELQELLSKKKPPQEVQQKMDQIDRRVQSEKEDMDQLLEQLKELRMEEQIDLQAQEMQDWIEKQQELQKQTEEWQKTPKQNPENMPKKEALLEQLQDQQKKAEQIQQRADEIEKQNKKLQAPMKLDLGKPEIKQAGDKQEEAEQKTQENKAEESKQKQQEAAERMKQAQEKMQESLHKAQKQRDSEDLQALRALLENLIEVSNRQEQIFTELVSLNSENPRVRVLNQEQMNIKNMSEGIEDSLRALVKRQPMVSDLVTREITNINDNMERAFSGLKVRNVREAATYEQFVMTGYNNLAVMLMESLKNVQQRMNKSSSSSPKNGKMCENPKPGNSGKSQKGKGGKLSQQQKELGEKLQKMQQQGKQEGQQGKEGQKESSEKGEKGEKGEPKAGDKGQGKKGDKGNKEGKGKPGDKGQSAEGEDGNAERLSDKEWVEMVLMQEGLRRKIEALRKEALKQGQTGQAANLFEAEKLMEQQEKKWVEKKFDVQMMQRQKQIETRLLEHEKAQEQQDQEDKRQSKTGEAPELVIPPEWIEKQRKNVKEKELLQRGAPQWQPYYRQKSQEYIRKSQP